MNYFSAGFPDPPGGHFVYPIIADAWNLTLEFDWPSNIQELWDDLQSSLKSLGSTDPLVTRMGYSRDYDYVELYSSIDSPEEWLEQGVDIPLSVLDTPKEERLALLQQRIDECKVLARYKSDLKEHLKWIVTVTDQFGSKTVAQLEPGGWYRNQTDDYSFKFRSTKDYIGYDDLRYVSIVIRTVD